MEEFRVKFRGVRGSYPTANKKFMQYGGNTACVEVNVGGHLIILDAGTGLIELGNELLENHLASGINNFDRKPVKATILLSHIHQDHIQGFPFFRPSHLLTTKLNVYGSSDYNENIVDDLAQILFTKSFPLDLGDIAADVNIYNLSATDAIILRPEQEPELFKIQREEDLYPQGDDVLVTCYKSYAHPQEGVLVYKISYKGKSLVYATDKESYAGGDKKLINFAKGCNLLIHDAQYTTEDYLNAYAPKQGYGHSTFDMALECQKQIGTDKLVFFHYDPMYDDEKLNSIAETYRNSLGAAFAREGLEINLL